LKSNYKTKYETNLPKEESRSLTTLIRKCRLAGSGDLKNRKREKQDPTAYKAFVRLINEIGKGGTH